MNQKERDKLVMRHLERAYRASHSGDSKSQDFRKQRGENKVQDAILDAISKLNRQGIETSI